MCARGAGWVLEDLFFQLGCLKKRQEKTNEETGEAALTPDDAAWKMECMKGCGNLALLFICGNDT